MKWFNQITMSFLFLGVISSTTPVWAEGRNVASDYKVHEGIKAYKNGDVAGAINDFRKALLLDPNNKYAKECLKELGLPDPYIVTYETNSSQIAKLLEENSRYKEQVMSLSEENVNLKKRLKKDM